MRNNSVFFTVCLASIAAAASLSREVGTTEPVQSTSVAEVRDTRPKRTGVALIASIARGMVRHEPVSDTEPFDRRLHATQCPHDVGGTFRWI
jgi:hypothetical protein